MFADEIFTLQKSTLLQYTQLPTIFADLGQIAFNHTKSFLSIENGVNLGPNFKIFLSLSEVPPKFLLSQRLRIPKFIVGFS